MGNRGKNGFKMTPNGSKWLQLTRPDQTRPDQTRPDQTRPDQTRPDQTKPDQTRPDQTKTDQTRLNGSTWLNGEKRVTMDKMGQNG